MKNVGFWGLVTLSLAIIVVGFTIRPEPIALSRIIPGAKPNAAWNAQWQQAAQAEKRLLEEAQKQANEEARLLALPPAKPGEPHFVRIETPTYTYVGWAIDSVFHGEGTYTLKIGNTYKGQFVNGQYNGYGVYSWASGSVYEGYWKDNQMDGHGKVTYKNGNTYEGPYVRGVRNGTFVIRMTTDSPTNCPSSTRLEVNYKNGVMEGNGKCYDAEGRILYEGPFQNGRPVNPYPSTK